jgi:hypothetical protein
LLIGLLLAGLALPGAALAAEATTSGASGETTSPTPAPEAQAPAEAETHPIAPSEGAAAPQVQQQFSQTPTPAAPRASHAAPSPTGSGGAQAGQQPGEGAAAQRSGPKAVSPSALTPLLPHGLASLTGLPSFFIESFGIPPFLLPIFQAAGTAYGIPWQVLAAINEVETDYGRDLSVSSAGAEGWMQFLPSSWAQYGVDANGDGYMDPYNPADAVFAAARYLRAAGGATSIKGAVFAYNHSQAYVDSVMLRAQLLGGTPSELLGAITALTEARFPVHAAAHFSDGFPSVSVAGSPAAKTLVGTAIYSQAGAPVIAVQDGEIAQIGRSPALGRFVVLRDAFGNTYTYAHLGDVASLYPVVEPHVDSRVSPRIDSAAGAHEPAPSGPASAGAQPRSPMSPGGTVSDLALGAAAALEAAPGKPRKQAPPAPAPHTRAFRSGSNDVFLHPLRSHVQVIAGTVLGHVGAGTGGGSGSEAVPHLIFQIRPAGAGAPLIDPKPILDGWVSLENTSIFRAKGENPFLATSPSVGQVLLESKQQLERQVLRDRGIGLGGCGRQDVQGGRVDKRVLALLEYLSVSGLKPTAGGLACAPATQAALAANASARTSAVSVRITAVNGVPIAGHQGSGSIADITVRKLLMLQGAARPLRIASLLSYPGARIAVANPTARGAIAISYPPPGGTGAHAAGAVGSVLDAQGWARLIARLGEIPDPTVGHGHSSASIPDAPARAGAGRRAGGNH